MNRRWRQISSYACDMLGGAFYLVGILCVLSLTKFSYVIIMAIRALYPGSALPATLRGWIILETCGGICLALGTWIRTVADRMAPQREPEKSLLGL